MKKFLLTLFVLLNFSNYPFAQNRANTWQLGISFYPNFIGTGIKFSNISADTFTIKRHMDFFITDAGICDTSGNIVLYTNGIYVANRNNDTLQDSQNFNPGQWTTENQFDGLSIFQGAIVIPRPDSPSQYYIFHVSGHDFFAHGQSDGGPLHLSYSLVDMKLDSGLGGIVDTIKNVHCIQDTLTQGRITACKHANGRDWWIISHKYYSNVYYKLLVTPNGVFGPYKQIIGSVLTSNDIGGEACFSPDGSKYCMINTNDTLDVFQFNRCTGNFSNPVTLSLQDSAISWGCAFSSTGRYLYCTNYLHVYQFDLEAKNIQASMKLVASWDTTFLPNQTWFYSLALAADNKIYIATFGGCFWLHVINSPDSAGLKCNVQLHSFALPAENVCIPNFANYDLGEVIGDCDTALGIQPKPLLNFGLQTYPNPVNQWLNIEYQSQENIQCEIFDITGRMVTRFTLYPYFKSRMYDMSGLASGIYILKAMDGAGKRAEKKVVKE